LERVRELVKSDNWKVKKDRTIIVREFERAELAKPNTKKIVELSVQNNCYGIDIYSHFMREYLYWSEQITLSF